MKANMAEPIQIDLSAFYSGSIVPRWQDLLRLLAIVALSFGSQDQRGYADPRSRWRYPQAAKGKITDGA